MGGLIVKLFNVRPHIWRGVVKGKREVVLLKTHETNILEKVESDLSNLDEIFHLTFPLPYFKKLWPFKIELL